MECVTWGPLPLAPFAQRGVFGAHSCVPARQYVTLARSTLGGEPVLVHWSVGVRPGCSRAFGYHEERTCERLCAGLCVDVCLTPPGCVPGSGTGGSEWSHSDFRDLPDLL